MDALSEQLQERGLGANNQGDLASRSCPVFFEKPQASSPLNKEG